MRFGVLTYVCRKDHVQYMYYMGSDPSRKGVLLTGCPVHWKAFVTYFHFPAYLKYVANLLHYLVKLENTNSYHKISIPSQLLFYICGYALINKVVHLGNVTTDRCNCQ